jgi:hypothetical protein
MRERVIRKAKSSINYDTIGNYDTIETDSLSVLQASA